MSAFLWWLGWFIHIQIWPNQLLQRVKMPLFWCLWLLIMTVTSSMTSSIIPWGGFDHYLSYYSIIFKKSLLAKKIIDDVIDDVIRGSSMTIWVSYSESWPTCYLSDREEFSPSGSIWPSWWSGRMMSLFCQMMSGIVSILPMMMSELLKKFISNSESMTPIRLSNIKEFFQSELIWLS